MQVEALLADSLMVFCFFKDEAQQNLLHFLRIYAYAQISRFTLKNGRFTCKKGVFMHKK